MRRHSGLNFARKRRKKINIKALREVLSFGFWIVISVFLAFVFVFAFGYRTNVVGSSMEPNLLSGQKILINRLVYQISSPKFYDVIAFVPNGNEDSHIYVKRVIGVPGDTILIKDGYIYINGIKLSEDSSYDVIKDPGIAEAEIYLSDDEYFVLGDNRNYSEDSRSGNIGVVKKSYITGKVWFKLSKNLENLGFVK